MSEDTFKMFGLPKYTNVLVCLVCGINGSVAHWCHLEKRSTSAITVFEMVELTGFTLYIYSELLKRVLVIRRLKVRPWNIHHRWIQAVKIFESLTTRTLAHLTNSKSRSEALMLRKPSTACTIIVLKINNFQEKERIIKGISLSQGGGRDKISL